MKLSQTRQAILREFEAKLPVLVDATPGEYMKDEKNNDIWINNLQREVTDEVKDYLTQALNDYTESIVRMVGGIEPKCPITSSEKWAYEQALNDIKEELEK